MRTRRPPTGASKASRNAKRPAPDYSGISAGSSGTWRPRGRPARSTTTTFAPTCSPGSSGYTFQGLPGTPKIELQADDFSGDNSHSSTIGTFNAMYPRLPYFAELALFVPSNLKDVRPVLVFNPIKDVQATFGWDSFWRSSTTDGLYGSGLVEYAKTNSLRSRHRGSEPNGRPTCAGESTSIGRSAQSSRTSSPAPR